MTALTGWTPVHVSWTTGAPVVEWRDLRGIDFTDPLLDDAVRRALREPYRLLFAARTPIDELGAVADAVESVPPSGFVFHASRCGSTLISNVLARLDDTVVASEPAVVDGVLRADVAAGIDDETRRRWLGWALGALGQPRAGGERRFFVKFDAWATRDAALVRAAFPEVPCVFIYRDPAEIIASHLRMRGAHMVPGMLPPELFELLAAPAAPTAPAAPAASAGPGAPAGAASTSTPAGPEDHCARVLGSILASACRLPAGGCRLVHYRQPPESMLEEVLDHFGVEPSIEEQARMREVGLLDAKNPVLPFDPAERGRVWPVTPAIRTAVDAWAARPYAGLEARRAGARVEVAG